MANSTNLVALASSNYVTSILEYLTPRYAHSGKFSGTLSHAVPVVNECRKNNALVTNDAARSRSKLASDSQVSRVTSANSWNPGLKQRT